MFTVTDEDRKLRDEGHSWKARCELALSQDHPSNYPMQSDGSRSERILKDSLKTILRERTELIRLRYRQDRDLPCEVAVTVSQRAIVEAMAQTRMKVMSELNVRKLIYRFLSDDFEVSRLQVDFEGRGGLTIVGHRYTSFFLRVME